MTRLVQVSLCVGLAPLALSPFAISVIPTTFEGAQ